MKRLTAERLYGELDDLVHVLSFLADMQRIGDRPDIADAFEAVGKRVSQVALEIQESLAEPRS